MIKLTFKDIHSLGDVNCGGVHLILELTTESEDRTKKLKIMPDISIRSLFCSITKIDHGHVKNLVHNTLGDQGDFAQVLVVLYQ